MLNWSVMKNILGLHCCIKAIQAIKKSKNMINEEIPFIIWVLTTLPFGDKISVLPLKKK